MAHSNIGIIEVPEVEKEGQEIETLLEKLKKEEFPMLTKEIDFQEVQEPLRVPKKGNARKHIPRQIIILLLKMKEKERMFKAASEKETVTYKGVPIRP